MRRTVAVAVVWLAPALVAGASAGSGKPSLNLTLAGSAKGASLAGKVQFATVMCVPLTGAGLQVNWSGDVKSGAKTEQVSGSFQFSTTGKSTFGPHGTATAALVVAGDYSGSLGSGLGGAGGAGTVAANRKSGSANVTVKDGSSKVRENGSWVCG